jgi:multiple sugar transport system permease protein
MKFPLRTLVIHIVAWTVAVAWIIPFLAVLISSVRPTNETLNGWWILTPLNLTLSNFITAFFHDISPMSVGLRNSFLVVLPATLMPLVIGALAGYGFARFSWPIRDYVFLTIVLLMAIPQMMVVIPLFQIMVDLNLVNTFGALILIHMAWGLPWIILFMRNFFGTLPVEIEEAARVDGASDAKVFFRVVLPMAFPAFASVFVLQFMWVWSDFFFATIFIQEPGLMVATQLVPRLAFGQFQSDWGLLTAASLLVMIVPIIVYAFLQKFYVRGMIGWTVKR